MSFPNKGAIISLKILLISSPLSLNVLADDGSNYQSDWRARLSFDRTSTENYLYQTATDRDFNVSSLDLRYNGLWTLPDNIHMNLTTLFYVADGVRSTSANNAEDRSSKEYAELYTLSATKTWLENYGQWALTAGRQRLRESTGYLWDQNIESISLEFDSTLLKTQLGISQQLMPWRTDHSDFDNNDENTLYLSASLDYQWVYDNHLRFFALSQNDYSGRQDIGEVYDPDDLDRIDLNALWLGAGIEGAVTSKLTVFSNFVSVSGAGKGTNTVAITEEKREITGHTKYDVSGWLLDAGANWSLPTSYPSILGTRYTMTSAAGGDSGDQKGFIQSDMATNRYQLDDIGISMYRTGYAYRQDLVNSSVFTVLWGARYQDWRTAVQWNLLRRRNTDAAIGSSNISSGFVNALQPGKKNIGQTLDMQFVWAPEIQNVTNLFDRIEIRARGGWFKAGNAYGDDTAGQVRSRVLFEFIGRID